MEKAKTDDILDTIFKSGESYTLNTVSHCIQTNADFQNSNA